MPEMRIPQVDNPFSIPVEVGTPGQKIGLVEAKEGPYSLRSALLGVGQSASEYNRAQDSWDAKVQQTRLKDFATQLEAARIDLRDNPDTGYINLKGSNALEGHGEDGLQGEVQNAFRAKYDELYKQCSTPVMRNAMEELFKAQSLQLRGDVNSHILKQQGVYADAVQKRTTQMAFVKTLSDDPIERNSGMAILRSLAEEKAKTSGTPVDYTETCGEAHSSIIDRMCDGEQLGAAKKYLAANKGEMSAKQIMSAQRKIKTLAKAAAKKAEAASLQLAFEKQFGTDGLAAGTIKQFTGQSISAADWQRAMELAGGDSEQAVRIATIGIDNYEVARTRADNSGVEDQDPFAFVDANKRLVADRAVQDFRKRGLAVTNGTMNDIVDTLQRMRPGADEATIFNAAKRIASKRQAQLKERSRSLDENVTLAYNQITGGVEYDKLPQSVRDALPDDMRTSMKAYSDRMNLRSHDPRAAVLETDQALSWELNTNDDALKNMSDAKFYSLASKFSLQDFENLRARREAMRSGAFGKVSDKTVHAMVKDALFAQGIEAPTSKSEKQLFGMVVGLVEDELKRRVKDKQGKPLSEQESLKETTDILQKELTLQGRLWGTNKAKIIDVLKGKTLTTSSKLDGVLNAGLRDLSIIDPSDRNRTNLLLQFAMCNRRPIPGADAMAAHMRVALPKDYGDIVAAIRAKKRRDPTPQEIVRTYIFGQTNQKD